jgi:hypothetical protein
METEEKQKIQFEELRSLGWPVNNRQKKKDDWMKQAQFSVKIKPTRSLSEQKM